MEWVTLPVNSDPLTESPFGHVYINYTPLLLSSAQLCFHNRTEHNANSHGGPVVACGVSLAKCVHTVECCCTWCKSKRVCLGSGRPRNEKRWVESCL